MLKVFIVGLALMSFICMAHGLKCPSKLVSTHPGINGTDEVTEMECRSTTTQCILAKCTFAEGHVIATGCKESPKKTCQEAVRECEKAGGKLEECSCEPGGECIDTKEEL